MRRCIATWTTILGLLGAAAPAVSAETLRVGSKRFTESYVLAEILVATARPHAPAEHRPGLGNTAILFAALQAGSIDLYPEYLGTIEREILKLPAASGSPTWPAGIRWATRSRTGSSGLALATSALRSA